MNNTTKRKSPTSFIVLGALATGVINQAIMAILICYDEGANVIFSRWSEWCELCLIDLACRTMIALGFSITIGERKLRTVMHNYCSIILLLIILSALYWVPVRIMFAPTIAGPPYWDIVSNTIAALLSAFLVIGLACRYGEP
jgi:hypothetical protein